jgi:NAD(P)H-flavin reductase/hemoglobin-like flavoprotein
VVEVPPVRGTDAELVRASFATLSNRSDSVARLVYATLFAIDPPTRDLFLPTMTAQRGRFVAALAHLLGRVDDPDRLVPFLAQLGRDHRKLGVHTEQYASAGAALVTSVRRHCGDRWDDDLERAWTRTCRTVGETMSTAARTVGETMSTAARTERGPRTWAATVVEHRRLRDDLAVVGLLTDRPVPRAAGEYVSVQVPQMWRWMSPASAPNGTGELELQVRAVPGGWVSGSIVAHTRVRDRWLVGPALGRLSADRACGRDVLMVAGGTGLAPLRAIVEQMATKGANPRVQLFVGGRTRTDLYDLDALQRTATTNPRLTVVPVLEEPVGRAWCAPPWRR